MASLAIAGLGATLSVGNTASPISYTTIGEISTLNNSGREAGTADVTNLSSTAREFIMTLPDNGTVEFAGNLVASDAGQVALIASFNAGTRLSYKLQFPIQGTQTTIGNSWTFLAIVQSPPTFNLGIDKAITFDARLKVSGGFTVTTGS